MLKTFLLTIAVSAIMMVHSCKTADNTVATCIDELKISEGPCTMDYTPVCGCDGKTYSNACVAGRSGVTTWTAGECAEK